MRHVSTREALTDLNKFARTMRRWCDQNGEYENGVVSVSDLTLADISNAIDAVLAADGGDVRVPERHDSIYAYLCASTHKRPEDDGR